MSNFVRNERTKLTATYLNGIAIAILAVGALGPLMTALYGDTWRFSIVGVIGGLICIIYSLALPLIGRRVLKGLSE